ncbi:MAG TPA: histidine kinase [Gemmatimonadaceae bacterium]|nr:histidine kinase [Gemmatimonadaceae bacterium]
MSRPLARLLGVPLLAKLAGANLIVGLAGALVLAVAHGQVVGETLWVLLAGAVTITLAVNLGLVAIALRPLWTLEATAASVWAGDFGARVPASMLADRDMARVGRTFNLLLDGIADDRARLRKLASLVVSAQDEERARIARELHDSTAQTLAALQLQLAAAARDSRDPALAVRLEETRALAEQAVEEVRSLAHSVHPRVLDDLGLPAALAWLARQTRERTGVDVVVDTGVARDAVPAPAGAVLYRVAQEALRNVVRHAGAERARIALSIAAGVVTIEVRDDGRGFDVAEAERRRPGMGLFAIRERVALADGVVKIESGAGSGTRVIASVPLYQELIP